MNLAGTKIILGVTGSIAAYKSVFLARMLIKEGADVKVIMTPSATQFVGKITFSTLTGHEVLSDINAEGNWNNHVELGLWADLLLIAPATAHTIAGMATGFADSMLLATYLSAKCPVWVAPAMDLDMWKHPATKSNIQKLNEYGHRIIDVEEGFLASGLRGQGRMAEPQHILAKIVNYTSDSRSELADQSILITAGPTHEPIDPVRFIGNRSSGKMGVALVKAALDKGATVHLVHGPMTAKIPTHSNLHSYPVQTAKEMESEVKRIFPKVNGAILCAAVSDYRPSSYYDKKLKSEDNISEILLEETQDIAAALGREKENNQWLAGFALETNNIFANAKNKRKKKNFDFIVLNTTNSTESPFGADANKVWIISKNDDIISIPKSSKTQIAHDILSQVVLLIDTQENP
ncbi:MAG: bifunctional phosphopantothenoylcysteine decarboxylase/phosphopantothenate--cysteine ligase CoaBC [Bacteroidetes bacterium]|jgi:phosphopantothenoylcysteine decarboxylase/phosphopantothenate--cysteine ligase|nr:bifunctional phosphopantothenoylcysteine decarboxylase/phosphopantothenate--cysteine ligase CoaBC [Bacteroidota bacterium]